MIINQTNIINTNSKLPQVVDGTITEITAEDLAGATKIGAYAFYGSSNLTKAIIPNTVTIIQNYAFQNCTSLAEVRIGNGIVSGATVASNMFNGCSKLTDIYIDKPENSVSYAPWGAANATVHWNTPLPTEEA